jgi:PBSX family phage portal protein
MARDRRKRTPQRPPDESGRYSIRLLSLASKQAETRAEMDDPFQVSGLYGVGPRKFVLPPLGEGSLRSLVTFHDESNILPQCVAAYQQNIDGFGYRFDTAVKEEKFPKARKAEADREREDLEYFFDYAYSEGSFTELRKRMRKDVEITGIGYWEAVRDATGRIERLNHVPSWQVRMTGLVGGFVVVQETRRRGLELETAKVSRRFRLFCQIVVIAGKMRKVWFKQYGDPRNYDSATGEPLAKGTRSRDMATELMVFRSSYHPVSSYPLPRWIGNLPSVLGSRAAEEVNILYFDNKTIPPMVIAVSGGQLTKGTIDRIQEVIEYEIKGRENFHRALILEAVNPEAGQGRTAGARPQIEIKPLTDRMIQDGMFMNYDAANRTKNRGSFRIPPILTGETTDYNRATAETSQLMAEEQVFRAERIDFDYQQNRWLMPDVGAKLLKLVSLGPNVTLNEDLIAMLPAAEEAGGMTPNISRQIMSDVMEKELPLIEEEWGNRPFSLTKVEANVGAVMEQLAGGAVAEGGEPSGAPPASGAPGESQAGKAARQKKWDDWVDRLPVEARQAFIRKIRVAAREALQRRVAS